jgi:hypothetical protein
MVEKGISEPDSGEVFSMTNGEKIRVEFDRVFTYKSKGKGNDTIIELGWSDDKETYFLDITFDDFDSKYQSYKKAMREYYDSLRKGEHRIY